MHCLYVWNCKHEKSYSSRRTNVVICIDLSGKELHTQVGTGRMVTSGTLGGVLVSTMTQNARDVGSIPALGTMLPIFITPTTIMIIMIQYRWVLKKIIISRHKYGLSC